MAAKTIAVESDYGARYIHWLQPGKGIPKAYAGLFLSICCGCGKEQVTTGGTPLWCDVCLAKLRRPL